MKSSYYRIIGISDSLAS